MNLDELTLGLLVAIALNLFLVISGLVVGWRVMLSRSGRAAQRQPSPLGHWSLPITEFILAVFTVVIASFAGAIVGALASKLIEESLRIAVQAAGFQIGLLTGCAMSYVSIARPHRRREQRDAPAGTLSLPPPPTRRSWPLALRDGLFTLLALLPLVFAASFLWSAFLTFFGIEAPPQPMVERMANNPPGALVIMVFILAVVVAPVAEELAFRAGLFRFVRTRLSRFLALLFPAIVFASWHQNIFSLVPLTVLAVGLAVAYERTGDVRVTITTHALFNALTLLNLLLGMTP